MKKITKKPTTTPAAILTEALANIETETPAVVDETPVVEVQVTETQVPDAETELSATLKADLAFVQPDPVVETAGKKDVNLSKTTKAKIEKVAPVAAVVPSIAEIVTAVHEMGVTTNKSIIEVAEASGLVSKTMHSSDQNFFGKSFGERARKLHLKNYAPSYTLEQFTEIGLAYHAHKKWAAFPNALSYPLLGMAVLTGREPAMSHGVYTACGKSIGKHGDMDHAVFFKANEICAASLIKKVVEAPAETGNNVESTATVETAPVTAAKKIRGSKKAKQPEQAAA